MLYTDSTHLKANANKGRYDKEMVAKSRAAYWDDLDAAVAADRAAHGKKPLAPGERQPPVTETKVSRTDPDAGYMVRDGKPKGFFYLDHRTVDGAHAIITDSYVTPANVHDSIPYLARLDRQRDRFGFDPRAVGLDAGHASAPIAKGLEDRGILGVTGYLRPSKPKGMLPKRAFAYEAEADAYRCPEGQIIPYATTDRTGYRHYSPVPRLPAAGLLHHKRAGAENPHPPPLGRCARAGGRPSPDRLGQGPLQATTGDSRAVLR